ncbi:pyridoxamine kinase [Megasphaera paucivorans]|uniref:pyridoxal kinase n=1 Tax=Megasphaera paucivorans TaxID=349095 RepID=A0A1G9XC30_9FIRM|nr:pyridoxamine kinase [Megasphaera paucivorans]SDM93855.1 pyridoxine kinase [Megasphaera paucivorans]
MKTPRVLAIHDMCAFGRCSLTAVLPVLSAMGIQVCPFPTAIYSNNLTYDNIDFYDFSPHMRHFMDIWQKNGYQYDAIYSGFLANAEQISIVEDAISRFAKKDTTIIVDPAMADNGNLYPVFKPAIIDAMRHLISKATVITPNYTEACLLLNIPYTDEIPTTKKITTWCQKLSALGPSKIVITSVPASNNEIKNISYDSMTASFDEYTISRIPFNTCGTGDLFTSVLTGCLLKDLSLHDAVSKVISFMNYCINYTYQSGSDPREGVQIEPCLLHLQNIEKK